MWYSVYIHEFSWGKKKPRRCFKFFFNEHHGGKNVFPCFYQQVLLFSSHHFCWFLGLGTMGELMASPVQNLLMRSDGVLGTTGAFGLAPCRRAAMDQQYNEPITWKKLYLRKTDWSVCLQYIWGHFALLCSTMSSFLYNISVHFSWPNVK